MSKQLRVDEVLIKVYVKGRHNLPEITFFFSCNLCLFTKIYVTNFAEMQFWWIAKCSFNGIRNIFIQIFVQVNPNVDYTIRSWG